MESACGVADNNIGISCLARTDCIKNNCGGVGTFFVFNNINICTLCPDFKLVNSCGSESIGCTEDNLFALFLEHCSHFAD